LTPETNPAHISYDIGNMMTSGKRKEIGMRMRRLAVLCLTLTPLMGLVAMDVSSGASPATQPAAPPDTPARRAYETIKSLAGTWEGKSSKGWTEVLTIRTIAAGSSVIEESRFAHDEKPENNMVTMYHLDGEHLMLTHYCMAKNQPRLRATQFSDDGKKITFEFLDGTNMASRDVGHMDKVVVQFEGPDRFRSQWTFYAKGKEQWMEEITYKRVHESAATPVKQQ
jgi:hypothetical protein